MDAFVEVTGLRIVTDAASPGGATTLVHMAVADGEGGVLHLHARLPPGAALVRGQKVGVALDPGRAFAFPRSPGGGQGASDGGSA